MKKRENAFSNKKLQYFHPMPLSGIHTGADACKPQCALSCLGRELAKKIEANDFTIAFNFLFHTCDQPHPDSPLVKRKKAQTVKQGFKDAPLSVAESPTVRS
jgi:hypothetical protein